MKIRQRFWIFSWLFACVFVLGCSDAVSKPPVQEITEIQIAETAIPSPISTAAPQPAATAEMPENTLPADTPAAEALDLDDIDRAVFTQYVTSNGYVLQCSLIDPAAYGIEETEDMQTWGAFTEESAKAESSWAKERLSELTLLNRETMTERQRLSYDILKHYLEQLAQKAELFYHEEPLSPRDGVQANIPMMLSLYRLETKEDVENYFLLISDIPRYFSELLAHAEHRAHIGTFMTKASLDAVLQDCSQIIEAGDSLFIEASFEDALDEMEGLSKSERNEYLERHETLINDTSLPAYEQLYHGLESLAAGCRPEQGLYALGDISVKQYAYRLAEEASSEVLPEDALSLLDAALADLLATMQAIYADDPSVSEARGLGSTTNADKLLQELQKITEDMLPAVDAEQTIGITKVKKSFADVYPSAMSIVPPIDDESDAFRMILNPHSDDSMLLLTLSHEGFPGHIYQLMYQDGLPGLGLLQRALPFRGYYESWAQMAEEWLLLEQTKYDQNAAMYMFCNSMVSDAVVPSIISILVNYYGYERDDIGSYLSQYGLQNDEYVDLYFTYAVTRPYAALSYGIGYAQLADLMRNMSAVMGENYLQKEVQKRYLDYGPAYFHLIKEQMDEWADTKMPE